MENNPIIHSLPEKGEIMYIASMIVKVFPEKAQNVLTQLERIENVTTYGIHKKENIIVVAEAPEVKELEMLTRYIMDTFEDVTGVFPTYLTYDDETSQAVPL